ncbi:MAG: hypothetical protein VKS61_09630 [Candidatus Sericytochromatia bacterium]|nr:hypothetical protein [Candidatus Sericytochromatia bacterium]
MHHVSPPPSALDEAGPAVTRITPLVPEPAADDAASCAAGQPPEAARPTRNPGATPTAMMARMAEALQAHASLMERYARAGYQIGRLETENKHLASEREALAAKLSDLELRLADSRVNEQVLEAERDRALQRVEELTLRLAEAGLRPGGRWEAVKTFLRRHW